MKYYLVGLLILSHTLQAQLSDQNYLINYKAAVQLYAEGQYEQALDKLVPLTSTAYNNSVVPYTLFYYARASMEANKAYQARSSLRDLFKRYPAWEKINEAQYLYALANFKDKYYMEAFTAVEQIDDPSMEKDVTAMIHHFVEPMESLSLLKDLNAKFPTQAEIAKKLVRVIQTKKYNTKADLELSDLLTNRFKIKDAKSETKNGGALITDRAYDDSVIDMGVLLPFDLKELAQGPISQNNRYAYDLYLGMITAEKKLMSERVKARVFGFDVGNSTTAIEKYLADPNFKKIDVVFGPLYGAPNKLMEEYAADYDIIQVHPMSNNSKLLEGSDSRFLLQPSNTTQAEASLAFVRSKTSSKTLAIYHGPGKKDIAMAEAYEAVAKEAGYTVLQMAEFKDANSITTGSSVGHLFFSGDASQGSVFIKAAKMKKVDQLIIANATSFNLENTSRGDLSHPNLYLLYPEYIDYEKPSVKEFRRTYIEKMNILPSYYAYLGYDMVLYYARMLKEGKSIFRLNLNESPEMDDLLLSGFNYSGYSKENKIVPIVHFENGQFIIEN